MRALLRYALEQYLGGDSFTRIVGCFFSSRAEVPYFRLIALELLAFVFEFKDFKIERFNFLFLVLVIVAAVWLESGPFDAVSVRLFNTL